MFAQLTGVLLRLLQDSAAGVHMVDQVAAAQPTLRKAWVDGGDFIVERLALPPSPRRARSKVPRRMSRDAEVVIGNKN